MEDVGISLRHEQVRGAAPRSLRRAALLSRVRIGTSGWDYASWRGPFFPKNLRAKDHLAFYPDRVDRIEEL